MTPKIPANHPLRLFFAGSVEDVFYTRLGICAPDLVDYLVDLLTHFVHMRDIYALKSPSGDILQSVTDMITKAYPGTEVPADRQELLIHRHVGDYTLYWTGLFPEGLERCKIGRDVFVDYCEQGKESYSIASELCREGDVPPAMLFSQLSDHFEDCAQGLTLARQSWNDLTNPQ